ncbi:unnamed protein product [Leptidea sinapis]|uniref:Uncharacterized protein n=1 Tax=Leptidea sinapis TaxID=189913 RepID=A0A5E4PXS7_9NEOP|nr:unnamed protein product [Leptidea sinapis]
MSECQDHYPAWFSKDLIRLLKEKYTWHLKFKKFKNPLDKSTFNLLKNLCSKLQNICYKSYNLQKLALPCTSFTGLSAPVYWVEIRNRVDKTTSVNNQVYNTVVQYANCYIQISA